MYKTSILAACFMTLLILSRADSSYGRLGQQKPLLFGRRGMNPNMNSLFFGKRAADVQAAYDEEEICGLCKMVKPTCNICFKDSLLGLTDDK